MGCKVIKRFGTYFLCIIASLFMVACSDGVGVTTENELVTEEQEADKTVAFNENEADETVIPKEQEVEKIVISEDQETFDVIDDDVITEEASSEDIIENIPITVDLILFAGQSNMSGCGGNAELAPEVIDGAGYEFRAISDPTMLYPIEEPFGINENNINGLMEKPGGKKGSLVSSFVNEYYRLTNTPVVAVSAARGETAMDQWLSEPIINDVVNRFCMARDYLNSNGYVIGHMYMVWLQGESDALKRLDGAVYKTKLDDFIRPLFIEGLQQVFIITPGRTKDSKDIYSAIVKAQLDACKESGYYALGTDMLCEVSTDYMTDIYHYNQDVLNMIGSECAENVAYYSKNNTERQ